MLNDLFEVASEVASLYPFGMCLQRIIHGISFSGMIIEV